MKTLLVILLGIILAGCATNKEYEIYKGKAPYVEGTTTSDRLINLPDLDNQPIITIAVYRFTDQTGQRKPSTKFSQLSTAVTQGASIFVIDALKKVSGGDWFQVVEREGLDNLVKERQLIRSTRDLYDGEQDVGNVLKPLLFAGLIIEGGIVGFDSNIQTGGQGARYLGIGITDEYRKDMVTVGLRLISVQTGEVLLAVSSQKTILSTKLSATVFKFLDLGTKLIETEAGITDNESVTYAVRKAIEQAVVEIIKEGEKQKLWKFQPKDKEKKK